MQEVVQARCSIAGCENRRHCRGFCHAHYLRWYRYGDPRVDMPVKKERCGKSCDVPGCTQVVKRNNTLCGGHQKRMQKHGSIGVDPIRTPELVRTRTEKRCPRCREIKRLTEYNKQRDNVDGLSTTCSKCERKRSKEKDKALRLECLQRYSSVEPACACCGESAYEFLAIDHIHGGGKRHHKKLRDAGTRLCLWLKKNKFPDGFRVLCHNCNMARGFYGYCPHEKQSGVLRAVG